MPGIKGPADKTEVKVNGRPMDVALSAHAPKDLSGDAYLSFLIDNDAKIEDAFKRGSTDDQYVGIIAGSIPKELIESKIEYATFKALKLMGEDGAKSVIIPVSGLLAKRMGLGDTELAASIFLGVNRYADHVRRDAEPDFVSEIVVAGGVALYLNWMDGGPMVSNIVKTPAEENGGAIVLKSGTFDLSPSGLGPRIGITGFHEETAMSREPDELQRAWLEMIGEDLVNVTEDRGFHRNSPMHPAMPNERKVIVTFDAGTGLPLSLQSGSALPPPENLASGEAAIFVEYFEVGGRSHMAIGKELVVSDRPADPEVLQSIVGITQFAPILPSADVDVMDLEDGTQLLTPDKDVDAQNAKLIDAVLNPAKPQPMTIMGQAFAVPSGLRAIAEYWSARTDAASSDDIYTFLSWRTWGHNQYDFYIDENGRFVGATMHQNLENSPRGTTYHIGSTTTDKTGARNVSFRSVRTEDGGILRVPISYEWRGKKALAFDAFQRWYNSIEFVRARNSIATEDRLSEIMFPSIAPQPRAVLLTDYLEKNPAEFELVDAEFYNVSALSMGSTSQSYGAYSLVKSIRKTLTKGEPISRGHEVGIAFIELLMRGALGEKKVDSILAPGETPSFGSAGNPPALPAGSGGNHGSKFVGIAREIPEGTPEATADDEAILAATQEEEMAAYAQGSGSQVVKSAAVIIGSQSAAGK